jgi:hypothetical protein
VRFGQSRHGVEPLSLWGYAPPTPTLIFHNVVHGSVGSPTATLCSARGGAAALSGVRPTSQSLKRSFDSSFPALPRLACQACASHSQGWSLCSFGSTLHHLSTTKEINKVAGIVRGSARLPMAGQPLAAHALVCHGVEPLSPRGYAPPFNSRQ